MKNKRQLINFQILIQIGEANLGGELNPCAEQLILTSHITNHYNEIITTTKVMKDIKVVLTSDSNS